LTRKAVLPRGQAGEVNVRGPNAMLGYWNKPEQTASTLVDGWVRTGDSGYLDDDDFLCDDDGFLYIVDRTKDMIVSGGESVYSAEVKNGPMRHPDVNECTVIGVSDPKWGERVHAIVVPHALRNLDAADLANHGKTLVAGYKCPRSIDIRREALPNPAPARYSKLNSASPSGMRKSATSTSENGNG